MRNAAVLGSKVPRQGPAFLKSLKGVCPGLPAVLSQDIVKVHCFSVRLPPRESSGLAGVGSSQVDTEGIEKGGRRARYLRYRVEFK